MVVVGEANGGGNLSVFGCSDGFLVVCADGVIGYQASEGLRAKCRDVWLCVFLMAVQVRGGWMLVCISELV